MFSLRNSYWRTSGNLSLLVNKLMSSTSNVNEQGLYSVRCRIFDFTANLFGLLFFNSITRRTLLQHCLKTYAPNTIDINDIKIYDWYRCFALWLKKLPFILQMTSISTKSFFQILYGSISMRIKKQTIDWPNDSRIFSSLIPVAAISVFNWASQVPRAKKNTCW